VVPGLDASRPPALDGLTSGSARATLKPTARPTPRTRPSGFCGI